MHAIACRLLQCLLLVIIYALFLSAQFLCYEYFVLLHMPLQFFTHVYYEAFVHLILVPFVPTNVSKHYTVAVIYLNS